MVEMMDERSTRSSPLNLGARNLHYGGPRKNNPTDSRILLLQRSRLSRYISAHRQHPCSGSLNATLYPLLTTIHFSPNISLLPSPSHKLHHISPQLPRPLQRRKMPTPLMSLEAHQIPLLLRHAFQHGEDLARERRHTKRLVDVG
jgi:hypothetical protein